MRERQQKARRVRAGGSDGQASAAQSRMASPVQDAGPRGWHRWRRAGRSLRPGARTRRGSLRPCKPGCVDCCYRQAAALRSVVGGMPRYVRGGQRVSRVRAAVRWAVSTTTEGSPAITRTWAAKRARDHEQARALCLYCKQWSADVSTTFDPDVAAMCFHRLGAAVVSVCWSAWFHRRRVASTIM